MQSRTLADGKVEVTSGGFEDDQEKQKQAAKRAAEAELETVRATNERKQLAELIAKYGVPDES